MSDNNMKVPDQNSGQSTHPSPEPPGQKKKKKHRPLIIVLDLLIVLLLGTGAFLLLKPYYIAWRQDQVMAQIDNILQETVASGKEAVPAEIWVDPNANAIDGEALEYFGNDKIKTGATGLTSAEPAQESYEVPEQVKLNILGKIRIRKINLELPLLQGAGIVELRYGAGWYETSAHPGENGRSTILGHTMYYNNRFFSLLPQLNPGDRIEIINRRGQTEGYTIYETRIVDQNDLEDYLVQNGGRPELMLVTCYNRPVWDQRLLVFASLDREG